MLKKVTNFLKRCASNKRFQLVVAMLLVVSVGAIAQTISDPSFDAGTSALETVSEEIVKYVPIAVKLCYAIAGVVAVVGAISVYIAMNNAMKKAVFKNIEKWLISSA